MIPFLKKSSIKKITHYHHDADLSNKWGHGRIAFIVDAPYPRTVKVAGMLLSLEIIASDPPACGRICSICLKTWSISACCYLGHRSRESFFLPAAVCSEHSGCPNDRDKPYVNQEVEEFISPNPETHGRRVIPVICREKKEAGATDCLPPVIRKHNLLAADIFDRGKERTSSDVIAKMIEVDPEILGNRCERKQRKKD